MKLTTNLKLKKPEYGESADIGVLNENADIIDFNLMPKSNGTLESYTEKLVVTTGTINLGTGNVFYRNATANTAFTIVNAQTQAHSFTLIIDMATVRTLTFPTSVKWQDGEIPDMTETNKRYYLTFSTIDGGSRWDAFFGGSF